MKFDPTKFAGLVSSPPQQVDHLALTDRTVEELKGAVADAQDALEKTLKRVARLEDQS